MVSDAPNSSWHPAMMPNSTPEQPLRNVPEATSSDLAVETPAVHDNGELPAHKDDLNDEENHGHDAWFGDDGITDSNWLADVNDAPTPAPAPASPPAHDLEQHEVTESVEQDPDADFTESANASKHLSTMSFTRTVSEEIMFNDDDDVEWNRPEASADPSNFFPDTERTNSFPNTYDLEHEAPRELEQPLPSTEAEDLIREIEREESDEKAADLGSEDSFGHQNGHDSHQSIGGELSGTAEEASDARFDEGLPLIPSAEPIASNEDANQEHHDLFGDNVAGEEDDFFSNVQNNEAQQEEDDFTPKPLERKSTADVLNALDIGPSKTSFTPAEETVEEEEPQVEPAQQLDEHQTAHESPANGQEEPKVETKEDLDAKWKEMFGDEDEEEFLPDEEAEPKVEVDAAAFLGSDDESLLDDEADIEPVASNETPVASAAAGYQPVNNRYLPAQTPIAPALTPVNSYFPPGATATPTQANPYMPPTPIQAVQPPLLTPFATAPSAPPAPINYGYAAQPPPIQEKSKAQSFVDKAKGGYTSPYDLPMEVVKPKKRASALRNTSAPIPPGAVMPPPPRSASLQAPSVTSSNVPGPVLSRPGSSHMAQVPPAARKASQEGFFEDLPITAKVRPASRHSNKSLPSPTGPAQYGTPPNTAPAPTSNPYAVPPPPASQPVSESRPDIPQLVAPPPANPYASLTSPTTGLTPATPAVASARYSPAPPSAPPLGGPVPPALSRYSPAPPSRQVNGAYAPNPTASAPPILPHQPRTSSPLAHFEINHEKTRPHGHLNQVENAGLSEKRSVSSLYDPRLQRVSSLSPTREVEEEDTVQTQAYSGQALSPPPMSPPDSRYAPHPHSVRQTPPPALRSVSSVLSPPKRAMSSHSPLVPSPDFAPPPRSQTQSPGALYGNRAAPSTDPIPRPSSVQDSASPIRAAAFNPPVPAPVAAPSTISRPRGFSLNLNVIPPTDGRENDPLQRWRGAPLISWGVGGTMVTMFPKEVPRYGINQSVPAVVRSPGDVKVKNAKDIIPLEERLAKFPGPLKGKSKKKEAISWLSAGIESLERALPQNFGLQHMSHEDKRASERVLLWKILRVFVENDGVLEGNATVEKAVRDLLSPTAGAADAAVPYLNGVAALGLGDSPATSMRADGVDSSVVEKIRQHLLAGESEQAIWAAVDQRLWGHALLLSNALKPSLYKQVAQEFVKKEVNFPGHNNESLAALYQVLSGNHEETVDELVPVHARAGLQLVVKDQAAGPTKNAMEGLDKWRETLSLILSNRSADDTRSINSLGVLLTGYGRAEAAHICFMFARNHTVFGGLDDPNSNFVLVGSDHKRQTEQFAKEIEPLLLSEVYEYGQSLAGGSNVAVTNPHLAAYKLQHAYALAEHGFRDKALQYCETIATAITAQTKRSPYHHIILEHAVEELMKRLKQAPSQESNSWIPKPTMNKVSGRFMDTFTRFVTGDDGDKATQGPSGDVAESGPFARIPGGTPTISRPPSANNLETFGAIPSYGMPVATVSNGPVTMSAPPTRAASRYAPAAGPAAPSSKPYAPRSSMERTSGEYNRGSFDLPRRSLDMQSGNTGAYTPARSASPAQYTPHSAGFSSSQESPRGAPFHQQPSQHPAPPSGYQPYGYSGTPNNGANIDAGLPTPVAIQGYEPPSQNSEASGYQPPSYGYEPPSFTPYEHPSQDKKGDSAEANGGSSYEPPSYQPYSYEPPSFQPGPEPLAEDGGSSEDSKPRPKKKGIMYDDEDDFPIPKPAAKAGEKTKEEKDRENAELFRKAAEEDAKRAEAAKQNKKGWGFGSWFGGAKKEAAAQDLNSGAPNKPIRAKLGEANSFYYDPELKRWINKNGNSEDNAKKATLPPPKSAPRSASSSPSLAPSAGPPMGGGPDAGRASAPPGGPPRAASANFSPPPSAGLGPSVSESNLGSSLPPPPGPVAMLRSASNTSTASAPPASRPLSNSSSIDDLLGAAGPRKAGAKKPRKSARYVDVMNKD